MNVLSIARFSSILTTVCWAASASPAASVNERLREQIDTDGVFLAIVDFSGDVTRIAEVLNAIYYDVAPHIPDVPIMPIHLPGLAAQTGLTRLEGLGMSSVRSGERRFRNRTFLALAEGDRGLFDLMGAENEPFRILAHCPPDAEYLFEFTLQPTVVLRVVERVMAGTIGPGPAREMLAELDEPVFEDGPAMREILDILSTRYAGAGKLDFTGRADDATRFDGFILLRGAGSLLHRLGGPLGLGDLPRIAINGHEAIDIAPLTDLGPEQSLFAMDREGDLVLMTGTEQLAFLRTPQPAPPAMQALLDDLPESGIALWAQGSESFGSLFNGMPGPDAEPAEKAVIAVMKRLHDELGGPYASVARHEADGIAVTTLAPMSHKSTLFTSLLAPVGLSAAMAIPAFQKVRQTSQEAAVLNNLRQIDSVGQQHLLEYGVESVAFDDIDPGFRLKEHIRPVAGEDYSHIVVTFGPATYRVTLADGREVVYERP